MIVAGFSGKTDLGKAAETANEVRRVMKDLKDCQGQGALFNQRERLFGMQVTQVSQRLLRILQKLLSRGNFISINQSLFLRGENQSHANNCTGTP